MVEIVNIYVVLPQIDQIYSSPGAPPTLRGFLGDGWTLPRCRWETVPGQIFLWQMT